MKRFLISINALFLFVFAAKANNVDGYYVSNNGDTVFCKIKISKPLLKKQEVNPLSVARRLHVTLPDGEHRKLDPSKVQSFKIVTSSETSTEFRRIANDRRRFYRVLAEGKINLYAAYTQHPYDHSPVAHLFASKDSGEFQRLENSELKDQLGVLIADDTDLYKNWMSRKDRDCSPLEFVKLYNSRAGK